MNEIRENISKSIRDSVEKLWGCDISPEIRIPENLSFGDLTTNVAFQIAPIARKSPKDIAEEISKNIILPNGIYSVVPVGGFINFTYSNEYLYDLLAKIISHPHGFGKLEIGKGKRVQIEFVSANPTGPLNVVSARAAAVGSSLVNVMKHAGFDVESEYYVNDEGNQIEMLGESFIARLREGAGLPFKIPEEDGYHGEYLADLAIQYADNFPEKYKELTHEWEQGKAGEETHPRRWVLEKLLSEIKNDLEKFNTSFDSFFFESEFRKTGEVEKLIAELKEKGATFEKDGALWFATDKFDPKEEPFVLVKSDGQFTYGAVDLAYHRNKIERGFDKVLDIWGPDHHGHIGRMKAAMRAIGSADRLEVLTLQQVNLIEEGKKIKMSKRTGNIVTLRELMDDVGVDVARYFFIARRLDSHLDFDLDLARKQSDENPVYYIQYAHARISNILVFAKNRGIDPHSAGRKELSALIEDEELMLARELACWEDVVRKSAEEKSPHYICFYLLELAKLFHPFYAKHRVVGDDKRITLARVALCRALKEAIALGLGILGISAPENM